MITRYRAGRILALLGFFLLAGSAFNYIDKGLQQSPLPLLIGMALLIIGIVLMKKNKAE